jgi:UDP-2,3-diacylglucosamine pyrophosphatase LpxH
MTAHEAYVVSDLHLGAGATEPALEDFDKDELFARFVARIGKDGVTLVLNGDTADFPQIPPYKLAPVDHLLWDEEVSMIKLETALHAHHRVFEALTGFITDGGKLIIHVGNHDLDLAWPKVQARLRGVLSAGDGALRFVLSRSVYHGVHIEHGHMFTPENATRDAEKFIHTWPEGDPHGRRYLERVWGTDFMLRFYNDCERKYPFADSIKPTSSLLYYGIKKGWVDAREVVRFILFLKRAGVPLSGILTAVLAPTKVGLPEIVNSLAEKEWAQALEERSGNDRGFADAIAKVIAELPPEQRALIAEDKTVTLGLVNPSLVAPSSATLGLFREDRERRAAKERLSQAGVTHVVFGHTHERVTGALDGCLYNTGTWLPYLDLHRADVKAKIKANGVTLDMLNDPSLYRAEPWIAHIVPDPPGPSRVSLVSAYDI